MSKIRVQHAHYFNSRELKDARVTIAVEERDGVLAVAAQFCSPNDNFVKKIGHAGALKNLAEDPILIQGLSIKSVPVAARQKVVEAVLSEQGPSKKWFPRSLRRGLDFY